VKRGNVNLNTSETVGAQLERDRLIRRARRVTAVIAALRQQASVNRTGANAGDRHIRQAIAEFEAEVAVINTRLGDLSSASVTSHRPLGDLLSGVAPSEPAPFLGSPLDGRGA
jgi:hypothetical protein